MLAHISIVLKRRNIMAVMLSTALVLTALIILTSSVEAQSKRKQTPIKQKPAEQQIPAQQPQQQKPETPTWQDKNLPEETTGCVQGREIIAASFYPKGREFDIKRPLTAMPNSRILTFRCSTAPLGITGLVWFKSGGLELYLNNPDEAHALASVEFRIFSYDQARRMQLDKIYLNESDFSKPTYVAPEGTKYEVSGGTINLASGQINQVIFIQLDKMKFKDGIEWKSPLDCTLNEDLSEITCQRKKP
jgi:hypothetical protein